METAVASATEPEDTVRILKDIRDEIRHARDELRAEIRGVRTERVDRPERSRTRTALFALGFGVALLGGVLILWRGGRDDGGRIGARKVGGEIAAIGASAPTPAAPILVPPQPLIAVPAKIVTASAPVKLTPPVAAAAPKRVPARHKVRSATEAELEEPAKL